MLYPFFPDLLFGWAFYAILIGLLLVAAVIDMRRMVVPKWLSLTLLALGVLMNTWRGAWLGLDEAQVWTLGENGWFVGALDGLLFSLAGFAVAFGLFFLMWIIGACGGGDVKLFAALGAWVGPIVALWILAFSTAIVGVIAIVRVSWDMLKRGRGLRKVVEAARSSGTPVKPSRLSKGITYAFPVALATAVALLWFWFLKPDLQQTRPSPRSDVSIKAGPPGEHG